MRTLFICLCTILLALSACRKDDSVTTDSSFMLEFSQDTVIFDTVFTTVGSATQGLKVYNRGDQAVSVASIYLAGGDMSSYRINVDGESGNSFSEVLIPGNDSIFVFIEVTIDPNNDNSPLIETDSLMFFTNGNQQDVDLVAWGQDAIFYHPTNQLSGLPDFTCLDGDCLNGAAPVSETWTPERPIVIYGYLIIDEDDYLEIAPGTQIYLHEGSGLWIYEYGQLHAIGSQDQRIVFQHDRQEADYDDIPGQWDLIRFNEGHAGQDNILEYVTIKNSILGIEAKPLVLELDDIDKSITENSLIMNNCIVQQTSAFGLLARKYRITAKNCLFANSGQNVCGISGGGAYDFEHCTFGNYWIYGNRTEPAFYASDVYLDEAGEANQYPIESLSATNCIFYGNIFGEFLIEPGPSQDLSSFQFDHCLFRIDEDDMDVSDENIYTDCFQISGFGSPGFVFPSQGDFHLEANAFVRDIGLPIGVGSPDLDGVIRDATPDLGCYEYTE